MINNDDGPAGTLAADAVAALRDRGLTVATAESLTGGLVCARLTGVPGASAVVLGGVVAYATTTKQTLAGAAPDVLAAHGPVAERTAAAMAEGVRARLGADVGLATTGVAGPTEQDGHPPGTVHIAMATAAATVTRSFIDQDRLPGDRAAVREATVAAALALLTRVPA